MVSFLDAEGLIEVGSLRNDIKKHTVTCLWLSDL
jgi:hypothetical protein